MYAAGGRDVARHLTGTVVWVVGEGEGQKQGVKGLSDVPEMLAHASTGHEDTRMPELLVRLDVP